MMQRSFRMVLVALGILFPVRDLSAQSVSAPGGKPAVVRSSHQQGTFASTVRPLLTRYCIDCHGATKPKAGLNLTTLQDESKAAQNRRLWTKVKENVESGLMPPEERPQPPRDAVETLGSWVESELTKADCGKNIDPGRVTIRRLNRVEYNNTIRDLVGVDFRPADDFPSDDVGYGFDNIGDVLTMPPILMEKYLAAAEAIAEQAIMAGARLVDRSGAGEAQKVEGPIYVAGDPLPESHRKIVFRTPRKPEEFSDCASAVVQKFATRAYRRPVTGGEVAKLLRFVDLARENGDSFERGIQLAVQAALVSPQFLFRVELNRGRRKPADKGEPGRHRRPAQRLRGRLAAVVLPLEQHARRRALQAGPGRHAAQARTCSRSRSAGCSAIPRPRAFVENFAGQWLQLRNLKTVNPDKGQFPSFDEPLREAMQKETELFFASVVREDRSILDFLDCDYTYLNERLARHYGIPGVGGDKFRLVQLKGPQRGGLITQASVLTVTSNPTRTSPVKRGKWVLEQILGTPPPPPPPNVPQLEAERQEAVLTGTLRQRMEQHRANPSCASCHNRLDPPGFGLENYDAVGAWRDKDGGSPIDASGKLPAGEIVPRTRRAEGDPEDAQARIRPLPGREAADLRPGPRPGRVPTPVPVDRIVDAVAAGQYKFTRLVLEIVKSDPFLKRRG